MGWTVHHADGTRGPTFGSDAQAYAYARTVRGASVAEDPAVEAPIVVPVQCPEGTADLQRDASRRAWDRRMEARARDEGREGRREARRERRVEAWEDAEGAYATLSTWGAQQ